MAVFVGSWTLMIASTWETAMPQLIVFPPLLLKERL